MNISIQPRPQGPFCHALEIGTPGQAQRHSDFEWLWKHNRLRPEPIRFVTLDSGHGRVTGIPWIADFRCCTWPEVGREVTIPAFWPKGSRPLGTKLISIVNMKVQLTERIFTIYNFKENRCLWNNCKDSLHFKTSSVRAAALEKLTTLLDHKTVEQVIKYRT